MSENDTTSKARPNLSKLPMLDNLANIDKLDRQIKIKWPEFSWITGEGNNNVRAFTMFAPDISRIGYDKDGRVYSIICPQQGVYSPLYGSLNIEITVTSQRGQVSESSKDVWADLTVEPKIWFSPSVWDYVPFKIIAMLLQSKNLSFPDRKSDAIRVKTFLPNHPDNPILQGNTGMDKTIDPPSFAKHTDAAWQVGNLDLGVGEQFKTGCELVDDFNALVMDIFNFRSMNLLAPGGTVSWNVWFEEPSDVNHCEWYEHADVWRRSLDTGHGSPDGPGRSARDRNNKPLTPQGNFLVYELEKVLAYLDKHLESFNESFASDAELLEIYLKFRAVTEKGVNRKVAFAEEQLDEEVKGAVGSGVDTIQERLNGLIKRL